MTAVPPADDDRFADLLCACDDALAAGTLPDVSGELPSAELRPRVEKGVAFLVRLRQLRASAPPADPICPAAIDRFVIRHELGRGGFGVVYLAFDPKLGREVALKVPHARVLTSTKLRERFRAEARTAAGLDHPNLVPVFETGEAGDLCYLVSAYCPGGTLGEWLRTRRSPVPPAEAAALVETLARAVHYAHERGVLHRDLKPANVLLAHGSNQTNGCHDPVPKIVDFGLAKQLAAENPETQDGTFVGTPGYMAPEQATTGGTVGPATDVYALGAILYECLTGRPPFQGDGPLDTLGQVRTNEPVPPRRLRPKLPRDLETVCLKCLEKAPARRYHTAGDLADDLDRYCTGRPVTARRVGPVGRTWRWARRRPMIAGLLAALVVALAGGGAGIVWQWRRAEANATAMRDQRDAAERERQRAETNFRRAGQAVREMTAAAQQLLHRMGHEEPGRKILEQAVAFHEGFVAERGDDPAVVLAAAQAWQWAARLHHDLGQMAAAITATERAVELYDRLITTDPANRTYRFERASRLRAIGQYYKEWGRHHGESERAYAAARQTFEQLSAEAPGDKHYRYHLANTLVNMSTPVSNLGRTDEAVALLERAIELQSGALVELPGDDGWMAELALAKESLGNMLWSQSRSARGDALCREARETYRRLAKEKPTWERYQWLTARADDMAGGRAADAGRTAEAVAEYREALRRLATLRTSNQRAVVFATEQLRVISLLAAQLRILGRTDELDAVYRQATTLAEKHAADFPDVEANRPKPTAVHVDYASFLVAAGRTADASNVLRAACRRWPKDAAAASALARLSSDRTAPPPGDSEKSANTLNGNGRPSPSPSPPKPKWQNARCD
jgi:tetratricopeptide (TPR) repeat protein